MSGSQRTRVAAYALMTDDDGRILLCRIVAAVRPDQPWTLPGGGIEFGEDPAAAVLRELREETGLVGEVMGLVDVSSRVFTPRDEDIELHAIRIVYRVRAIGGVLRDEPDGSTDRCAWLTPAEARRHPRTDLVDRALGSPDA